MHPVILKEVTLQSWGAKSNRQFFSCRMAADKSTALHIRLSGVFGTLESKDPKGLRKPLTAAGAKGFLPVPAVRCICRPLLQKPL